MEEPQPKPMADPMEEGCLSGPWLGEARGYGGGYSHFPEIQGVDVWTMRNMSYELLIIFEHGIYCIMFLVSTDSWSK